MKGFFLLSWLKDVSLTRKLYFVVGIMALLIAIELFTLSFMIHTLSSTRALVGAEGLWSKAEKDAVYSLTKYGYTHNEKDYQQYLKLLAVPNGDSKARLELSKTNPNFDTVREGFTEGRLHPDDIDGCIKLLTRFHNISYIHDAISIWSRGDYYLGMLRYLGERLHTQVTSGKTSVTEINATQDEIYLLNEKITVLEDEFSFTLGEGSRWIERLILKILFLIAMTVEFSGLFLTISVSRAISKGIEEIITVSGKIAKANFNERAKVFSKDEIGMLAGSFNKMIDDLQVKIKEERQAEEALLSQQNLYETLLKTQSEMGEGVSISEGEKIVYVNDAVCKIYGYTREEILGMRSFLEVIPAEQKYVLIERLKQRLDGTREQSSGETRIKRKDGKIIDIDYQVRNITIDGRAQMLSIIRDVTEKKKAEEQLHSEMQRAESAEIAKKIGEQFLANMSHEIRTPMNAIIGFTDIIMKTPLNPEQKKYLETIKMSGENLLVIINDILDLSRMRSGKIPIEQREFELSKVIANCFELMLPKAREKAITITTHVDDNVPDRLIGDSTRLAQMILNLTANALKFTSAGEVSIQTSLIAKTGDDVELDFRVSDTGIGIPKHKLATIFEAFTQADSDTARRFGGTGLGLTIVKQLAELQGGSVSVTSEEGNGSCFSFRLKYKLNNNPPLQEISIHKNGFDKPIRKLNVLVVEDNPMNQLLTKKILEDWGWTIDIVENGTEALEHIKHTDFDLVLMDIQMPEMDGYEATQKIRKTMPAPKCNVPIMAMTAHVMPGEEEMCYRMGMNGYISKPFETKTLYSKVASIVHEQ